MRMRFSGRLKTWHADRGFGFIADDHGHEWFFHLSGVVDGRFDDLREGQRVIFDEGAGPKGPRAERVQRA